MASEYIQDSFRGLIIPDDRINAGNLSAANSSYSQAGAKPGDPVPTVDSDLALESSGTQTAIGSLDVATVRGGAVGAGASFRWKATTDGATAWRGWNPGATASAWRALTWLDGTAVLGDTITRDPHAITLDDGAALFVYHVVRLAAFSVVYQEIRVRRHEIDGTLGAEVTVYSTAATLTQDLHPCLVLMPNGSIMLYHYLEDLAAQVVQVQSYISSDGGAAWALSNSQCLDLSIAVSSATSSYNLGTRPIAKMRLAYAGGQMLLLIGARSNDAATGSYQDAFLQYASSDLGNTFTFVEATDRTVIYAQAELVPSANGFEVIYLTLESGAPFPRRRSLAYAFAPFSTAQERLGPNVLAQGSYSPGTLHAGGRFFSDGELTSAVDDSGALIVLSRGHATGGAFVSAFDGWIRAAMDTTGGASTVWDLMGQGTIAAASASGNAGSVWNHEAANVFPRYLALTAQAGRLLLVHNWQAATGNEDNSLGLIYLGGYSNVTLPAFENNGAIARRLTWDQTWLPIERPNDMPTWALTAAGTNSGTLANGRLQLSTGAGRHEFSRVPTGTIAEGITVSYAVDFVSQTPGTNDGIHCTIKLEDGAAGYQARIYVINNSIKIKDVTSAAIVATATTTNNTEVLVFMKGSKLTVFSRARTYAADQPWAAVISNHTLADNGGGGTSLLTWGHEVGSTAASYWYWLNYTSDEYACNVPAAAGFTNPTDLQGRPYGTLTPTYVTGGVSIRGVDGPAAPSDRFTIAPRFDYPIENIQPEHETSRRREWRSTDETQQSIAWTFDGPNPYRTLGLWLTGINWRTGTLEGYNVTAAAWQTITAIDTATLQTGLPYVRTNDLVTVNAAASYNGIRYNEHGEHIGATADLGGGKKRAVTFNGAGLWDTDATAQHPLVRVAGIDGTEAANGTMDLWAPRILVVVHNVAPIYTGFRLNIAASQGTVDGYYKIGQMALGAAYLFTHDYSWGRVINVSANVDLMTYRDGTRSAFKRGEPRRSVTFGWSEGVDVSPVSGVLPDPDYVKTTATGGAATVGYRGDQPSLLQALSVQVDGAYKPLVYLPRINRGAPDTITLSSPQAAIFGRLVSDVQIDSLIGDELDQVSGEVFRIATVTIEEEL